MSGTPGGKPSSELLYDSDTMLRLVDAAIDDLGVDPRAPAAHDDAIERGDASFDPSREAMAARLVALSQLLGESYASIVHILSTLRRGRGTIEHVAPERLVPAHAKLQEATNTTEVAATDILDNIESALSLVDRLDAAAACASHEDAAAVRDDLRNTLFDAMYHLQFQDITQQQLNFASSVLVDTELRLAQIAGALEPVAGSASAGSRRDDAVDGAFDPRATAFGTAERQSAADEVLAAFGRRKRLR